MNVYHLAIEMEVVLVCVRVNVCVSVCVRLVGIQDGDVVGSVISDRWSQH